jgi:hypothetical protein
MADVLEGADSIVYMIETATQVFGAAASALCRNCWAAGQVHDHEREVVTSSTATCMLHHVHFLDITMHFSGQLMIFFITVDMGISGSPHRIYTRPPRCPTHFLDHFHGTTGRFK